MQKKIAMITESHHFLNKNYWTDKNKIILVFKFLNGYKFSYIFFLLFFMCLITNTILKMIISLPITPRPNTNGLKNHNDAV